MLLNRSAAVTALCFIIFNVACFSSCESCFAFLSAAVCACFKIPFPTLPSASILCKNVLISSRDRLPSSLAFKNESNFSASTACSSLSSSSRPFLALPSAVLGSASFMFSPYFLAISSDLNVAVGSMADFNILKSSLFKLSELFALKAASFSLFWFANTSPLDIPPLAFINSKPSDAKFALKFLSC